MGKIVAGIGFSIAKKMGKAINDYEMIAQGDRVLVAVSGGKDSLTLLTLLQERKKWIPIDYEIIAVHIKTDFHCGNCIHVETLREFFEKREYHYHFDYVQILNNADGTKNEMSCFWCSWNRRKSLFALAEKFRCNKLAFGHHKDDIIQTTLLNLFFQAQISTMLPKLSMFDGKLEIIRPLAHIDEQDIINFAQEQKFPSQLCACPFGQNSQRRHIKKLIAELEQVCPTIRNNIFNSTRNIREEYL